jgi:hypothetical protein
MEQYGHWRKSGHARGVRLRFRSLSEAKGNILKKIVRAARVREKSKRKKE